MTDFPVLRQTSSPVSGNAQYTTLRGGVFADAVINIGGTTRNSISRIRSSRCIKWIDSSGRKIFTLVRNIVSQSTNDGASFSTAFSSGGRSDGLSPGPSFLIVTGSNNQPYLVSAGENDSGGGFTNFAYRYDGSSWSNPSLPQRVCDGVCKIGAFQGIVFYINTNTASVTYDPVSNATTTLSLPYAFTSAYMGIFFSLGKRFFFSTRNSAGTGLLLWEWAFGVWADVSETWLTDEIGDSGTDNDGWPCAIKLDDDSILLIGAGNPGGVGHGLVAVHVQLVAGVPTPNVVTNTVIPPVLRPGTTLGTPSAFRVFGYVDNTDPDNARRFVWFDSDANTAGTALSLLEFYDENTQADIIGTTQLTSDWSVPSSFYGGGHLTFSPGELSIQIIDQNRDSQGLRIQYRCTGDAGVADKIVSFRYIDSLGVPNGVCTLVSGSAVGGGTVTGNTVTGVDADPSITHEVVWDFLADGVSNGSYLHDQAFIAKP